MCKFLPLNSSYDFMSKRARNKAKLKYDILTCVVSGACPQHNQNIKEFITLIAERNSYTKIHGPDCPKYPNSTLPSHRGRLSILDPKEHGEHTTTFYVGTGFTFLFM